MRLRAVEGLVLLSVVLAGVALAAGAGPASAAFPGANGRIAFVLHGDIWVIRPDGTGLRRVTTNPAPDSDPAWSPDGRWLAFTRLVNGNAEIYRIRRDGRKPTRLTQNPAADSGPAWSPDGKRIVFSSTRESEAGSDLFVMSRDGGPAVNVTNAGDFYSLDPAWSPVDERIAFARSQGEQPAIAAIGTDGTRLDVLSDGTVYDLLGNGDSSPSWSPDGETVAYARTREENEVCRPLPVGPGESCQPNGDVYVVSADGNGHGALYAEQSDDGQPAWSPDGTTLAFTRAWESDGTFFPDGKIYVVAADGSQARFLTKGSQPDWQPLPTPPFTTSPPTILGGARRGEEVLADPGRWIATPPVAQVFQWQRCTADGTDCVEIPGANGLRYALSAEDVGSTVRVTVTTTNDLGSLSVVSALSSVIGDIVLGSDGNDVVHGGRGPDLIRTGGGNDVVSGADGDDLVYAGAGDDILFGGPGDDRLFGGSGSDRLRGGPGEDRLVGGRGGDRILARDGYEDLVRCGPGQDTVVADRRDRVGSDCEVVFRV